MREVDIIHHFEDTPIRAAWDAELEEWFFSQSLMSLLH